MPTQFDHRPTTKAAADNGVASSLFDEIVMLPNDQVKVQYDQLLGLDAVKSRLAREGQILLRPQLLEEWCQKFHPDALQLLSTVRRRSPLFIFEGDVGTGKTALARSFGDEIARRRRIAVQMHVLSLNTRGSGAVGEMTKLISAAFEHLRSRSNSNSSAVLLIDEADSLAQSREFAQMHHEDRAGVNALIRGLDSLMNRPTLSPVLVVMCTNRVGAIDPAVLRRAAGIYRFDRPDLQQRQDLLARILKPVGLDDPTIRALAELTGAQPSRAFGFTYSDLTNRFLPELVLQCVPNSPVTEQLALSVVRRIAPTPPFRSDKVLED